MIRETSIQAYREIKERGLLSKRRLEVYEALFDNGPLTATQTARAMHRYTSPSVGANVHARLCELREMGAVKEAGEGRCPISGMNVILWDVTPNIPKKLEKKTKARIWIDPATLDTLLVSNNKVEGWVEFVEA